MYSTHQVQGTCITQTRLPLRVNVFVSLYKPIYLCINLYLPQCTSVFAFSCKLVLKHEPYTLYLMCTVSYLLVTFLLEKNPGKVSFVDYEYSGLNYAAFDIGNHFCEFAGKRFPVFIAICYFAKQILNDTFGHYYQ